MTKSRTRRRNRRSKPDAATPTARAAKSKLRRSAAPARNRKSESSASAVLAKLVGADPSLRAAIEEHKLSSRIAEMILFARTSARLTQAGLAERVGTTQSVISRLEDADYEGHSLSMLQRIADALGMRLDVTWTPANA